MLTRTLGPLEVPVVGLGCNNFGGRIDQHATFAVIDAAIESGVTFFDTADIYGNQGGSEELIGRALQGRREQVVLATKWGKPMGDVAERRGSREYILAAVEASLRRLQTDVIDLYQHHEEDPETPLEETVATVEQLVAEGTVRAWGTSNYRPETLGEKGFKHPVAMWGNGIYTDPLAYPGLLGAVASHGIVVVASNSTFTNAQLMTAGLDTTRAALGYIFQHLAGDDELRHRLTAHPELWPRAIEEFVRLYPLVIQDGRLVMQDIDFHGLKLKKGKCCYLKACVWDRLRLPWRPPQERPV